MLQISGDATAEDVRKAFRDRSRDTHPDKCGEGAAPSVCGQQAQEAVSLASEVLSDPSRRSEYDAVYVAAGAGPVTSRNLWATLVEKAKALHAAGLFSQGLMGIASVSTQAFYAACPCSFRLGIVLVLCKRAGRF